MKPTVNVPTVEPLGESSMTPPLSATHMLVPSNAMPPGSYGQLPTGKVPRTAPVGESSTTLPVGVAMVTHMLVPSNAIACGALSPLSPAANVPRIALSATAR